MNAAMIRAASEGHEPNRRRQQCSRCPVSGLNLMLYDCDCRTLSEACYECMMDHLIAARPKKLKLHSNVKRRQDELRRITIEGQGRDDSIYKVPKRLVA